MPGLSMSPTPWLRSPTTFARRPHRQLQRLDLCQWLTGLHGSRHNLQQKDAAVNLALQTAEAVASGAKDVPKNPIDTLFQEGFLAVEKQTQKAMAEPAILPENLDKAAMDLYTK